MRVVYQCGRVTFESEVANAKAAVEFLAQVEEIAGEESCGLCKSTAIAHDVREFGGNKYYKLVCQSCGAQMDFGQNRDGVGLFAKRRDSDTKQSLPNRGWYVWQGQHQDHESHPQQQAQPQQQQPAKSQAVKWFTAALAACQNHQGVEKCWGKYEADKAAGKISAHDQTEIVALFKEAAKKHPKPSTTQTQGARR